MNLSKILKSAGYLSVFFVLVFIGGCHNNGISSTEESTYVMVQEGNDYDNDGIFDETYYYTYDDNGNQVKREADEDNDGTIDCVVSLSYDDQGNQVEFEYDEDNDGIFDSVIFYTYDDIGNMVKEEYDSGNDGTIDWVSYYTWQELQEGQLDDITVDSLTMENKDPGYLLFFS